MRINGNLEKISLSGGGAGFSTDRITSIDVLIGGVTHCNIVNPSLIGLLEGTSEEIVPYANESGYATTAGSSLSAKTAETAETAETANAVKAYGVVAGNQPNFSNSGLYFLYGDLCHKTTGDISIKGISFLIYIPHDWNGQAIGISCRVKGDSGIWHNVKYCVENFMLGDDSEFEVTDESGITLDWFTKGMFKFVTTRCRRLVFDEYI
jgi:hypothetical protein